MNMLRRSLIVGSAFASIGFVSALNGQTKPAEDEKTVEIRQVLAQNCLICHSEELIVSQRLTPKQWGAAVDKMIGWGAPLPLEKKDALVAFLVEKYPDKSPKPAPILMSVDEALNLDQPDPMMGSGGTLPKGDATRGAPLYVKHCATCHGTEGKGGDLGSNLVEKPVLLREADYLDVMRRGRRRMPGFAQILNPEGEADILAWLRGRKGL